MNKLAKSFEKALTLFPLNHTVLHNGIPIGTVVGYRIAGDNEIAVIYELYKHKALSNNRERLISTNWSKFVSVEKLGVK